MKSSVLITGSRGFLGIHLKRTLEKRNYEVHELKGDVRELSDYKPSVDIVYHLAAITRESEFEKDMSYCFDVNITGTQAVLNYCLKNKARCIFTSTSGIYQAPGEDIKVKESDPVKPKSLYGNSKFIAENLCLEFSNCYGIPVTILRIFNLYGVGQKEPYLVSYIINRLIKGEVIKLRMPNAKRDFIYVTDAVDAIVVAGKNQRKQLNIYNIGSGRSTRVIDFVHTAEKIFRKKAIVEVIGSKYEEVHSMVADNKKAIIELRLKINTGLKEGIQKIKESLEYN